MSRISAGDAIDALSRAAELNRTETLRRGSLLMMPAFGQLVMTGDLHGNRRNYDKLVKYAALDRMQSRHVILHELIHQETAPGQPDTSYELLIEAARFKCRHPDQVHFLQSNHELAQLTGQRISKGGRDVIEDFSQSVYRAYGPGPGEDVLDAMKKMIASYPLAVRTENRVWLSHSLPNDFDLPTFDPNVVLRSDFGPLDRAEGGSLYALIWGRQHSPRVLSELAARWDVDNFIIGHQPQDEGFCVQHRQLIILASDHNHGTFLPFDLARPQTIDTLAANVRKFVEVA